MNQFLLPVARRFDRSTSGIILGILVLHLFVILLYVRVSTAETTLLTLAYPVIWIAVGLSVILTTDPGDATPRTKRRALGISFGYFGLLAAASGIISLGTIFTGTAEPLGVRIVLSTVPPGWGPALMYSGSYLNLVLIPFELIGYIALTYLVYVTILDVSGSVVTGLVGLFSCVSCTWPILGTVIASVFGSSSVVITFATNQPYGFSTIVFLTAIGLLYWRPFTKFQL